jgi:hypothetical protein
VPRDEAPLFWARMDGLSDRMQAPRIERVVLTHEAAAAAVAHQDAWLPWRHHHTLVLGVPLLAHLPPQEMEAVIAHELGHFSRHFGPAGHWLYRARLGWAQLLAAADDDIVWYRLAAGFARWFVPFFERRSAAEAVRSEYEADAVSSAVTTPEALARGLARLAVARAGGLAAFGEGPMPMDPLGRLLPGLGDAVEPSRLEQALQEDDAWHARQDPVDVTHPPARERMRAVGVRPEALVVPAVEQAAGPAWWGEAWAARLDAENRAWRARHARAWRNEEAWRQACSAQLEASDAVRALECGLALDRSPSPPASRGEPAGLPALTAYWTGLAWLHHDFAHAQHWLEASIQACVALAAPARRRLLEHPAAALDDSTRLRQEGLLAQALQRRDAARDRAEALGLATGRPVDAEPWRRAALVEALEEDRPVLQAAWLEHDVTLASGRRYAVVTLCLQVALDPGVHERGVAEDYAQLLARVITPARVSHVRTWWSTETWPEALGGAAFALKRASIAGSGTD